MAERRRTDGARDAANGPGRRRKPHAATAAEAGDAPKPKGAPKAKGSARAGDKAKPAGGGGSTVAVTPTTNHAHD